MLLLLILKYLPVIYLYLDVSKTVPEPITLSFGKPESLYVMYVSISTGFDTTRNIASLLRSAKSLTKL